MRQRDKVKEKGRKRRKKRSNPSPNQNRVVLNYRSVKTTPPKKVCSSPVMKAGSINGVFPCEMLERVFCLLAPSDLRSVVLVCRRWREVGEAPHLWAHQGLTLTERNLAGVEEVLTTRRLAGLQSLTLKTISQDLFHYLHGLTSIRNLDMSKVKLTYLENGLLPLLQSLPRLERLALKGCGLSHLQATQVCQVLREGGGLRSLDLSVNNLGEVEPALMAEVVGRAREARLVKTCLSNLQVSTLLMYLGEDTYLTSLDLSHNSLYFVDPALLARAALYLKNLTLWGTDLTYHHLEELCITLKDEARLRSLDLTGIKVTMLDPSLLAGGVNRLEKARLVRTGLSYDQATALCSGITDCMTLRSLDLSFNNLSSVRSCLLARAMVCLEEVSLWGAWLTPLQAIALCGALGEHTPLRRLDLSNNDLSEVNPEVLVRTVTYLERVSLMWACLTTGQATALCSALPSCSRCCSSCSFYTS